MAEASTKPASTGIDAETLADAITRGITATQPPRNKTVPEREAELGPRPAPKRPVFQNGFTINPRGLSADTCRKLDDLRGGKYLDGRVIVQDLGNGAINIRYDNATPDQRMANKDLFSSFSDLVFKLFAEDKQRK